MLEALSSDALEAFENKAKAQLPIQDHGFGSRFMVKLKRDELILHEHLGFSIWPQLLAQLSDRLEADRFLETIQPCQLEAIEGNTLIISTPEEEKAAYTTPPRPARRTRSGTEARLPHPHPCQGKECLAASWWRDTQPTTRGKLKR
jgi:hypothetical protein